MKFLHFLIAALVVALLYPLMNSTVTTSIDHGSRIAENFATQGTQFLASVLNLGWVILLFLLFYNLLPRVQNVLKSASPGGKARNSKVLEPIMYVLTCAAMHFFVFIPYFENFISHFSVDSRYRAYVYIFTLLITSYVVYKVIDWILDHIGVSIGLALLAVGGYLLYGFGGLPSGLAIPPVSGVNFDSISQFLRNASQGPYFKYVLIVVGIIALLFVLPKLLKGRGERMLSRLRRNR